jgi:hypothetical protein
MVQKTKNGVFEDISPIPNSQGPGAPGLNRVINGCDDPSLKQVHKTIHGIAGDSE